MKIVHCINGIQHNGVNKLGLAEAIVVPNDHLQILNCEFKAGKATGLRNK